MERREEEVEAEVVYDALRGQEQSPPGMRPVSLFRPRAPQEVAATVGYVAAWAPRLTPVVLELRALVGGAAAGGGGGGGGCGSGEEAGGRSGAFGGPPAWGAPEGPGGRGPCDSSHLVRALQGGTGRCPLASPGRYTNIGRRGPRVPTVLHDPGGSSGSGHRQTR